MESATFGTHAAGPSFDVSRMEGYGKGGVQPTSRAARATQARPSARTEAQMNAARQAEAAARDAAVKGAAASARGVISNPQNIPTGTAASPATPKSAPVKIEGYSKSSARRRSRSSVSKGSAQVAPRVQAASGGKATGFGGGKANRGMVSQITPHSKTLESSSAHSKRMSNRKKFAQGEEVRSRRKRILVVLLTLVLAAGVAYFAGSTAFNGSVNKRMAFPEEMNMSAQLTPAMADQPYYVLLTANIAAQTANATTTEANELGAMALARVDEATKQVTLIVIPKDIRIAYSGSYTSAAMLYASEGEAALVSAMATFLDVGISHCIHINAEGFSTIIDDLGGVPFDVPEEIDDPSAGNLYIAKGEQVLDSQAACVLMRASNYTTGTLRQMEIQELFAKKLGVLFFTESGFKLGANIDKYSHYLSTDMTAKQLRALFNALSGITAGSIYTGHFEGYDTTASTGEPLFVAQSNNVLALMEKIGAGQKPDADQQFQGDVDRGSFTISVKNGGGITGGAGMVSEILTENGFNVVETGNADSYVYTETLVIYLDDDYEDEAQAVLSVLGIGRVIDGTNFYIFDSDVQVILGSDWKPLN